jgi:hypothetical protein
VGAGAAPWTDSASAWVDPVSGWATAAGWGTDRARHAGADEHAEIVVRFAEFRAAVRGRWPGPGGDPTHDGLADDAIDHALHALSAALLTDDPRLLREAGDWLTALFAARGAPADSVPGLWRALLQTVGEPLPEAARHLKAL